MNKILKFSILNFFNLKFSKKKNLKIKLKLYFLLNIYKKFFLYKQLNKNLFILKLKSNTKYRKNIIKSKKKLRKQKGFGKARISNLSSSLLKGGNKSFGPKFIKKIFKINKKENKILFQYLLYKKKIYILIFYFNLNYKKKNFFININFILNYFGISITSKILLIIKFKLKKEILIKYINNIFINIIYFNNFNFKDLFFNDYILILI